MTIMRFIPWLMLSTLVNAQNADQFLQQAIQNPARTEAEMVRDKNRQPIKTLVFFGLQPTMTVVEIMPGGGWYSKILNAAVVKQGHYYAAVSTERLPDYLSSKAIGKHGEFVRQDQAGYVFEVDQFDLGVSNVDMVLTFRNAHNLTPATRQRLNEAIFEALKPGGVYGVVDHSKRHMEAPTDWTWRRLDPVMVIQEVVQAGFIFEGFSDIHARAEDELKYDTKHDSLVRETDRFTLKFRKPE
ncbi:hypothetical protein SIN8267_00320 [Sinobacterium norvegicum]|uniref:Methyltransferase n=1 Tax=Sinobacterium norvegicum TaxID=1641715 RepID=A0ABN8ECK9_9GAMM|nr:methyltransferase [Sinobacterium norvegicum]CAH0990228.1 hypothetical protein SIN8267_00320 [Sinobacterium norvegicum]